jgi:hypothetical protein
VGRLHRRARPRISEETLRKTIAEWKALLDGPPGRLPEEADGAAAEAFRELASTFLERVPAFEGYREQRGVVICAGGLKLFTNAWVCLNSLRRAGCTLPAVIWARQNEITPYMARLLRGLGASVVEAETVRREHPARILNGWELKSYSLLHTPFKEILLLDADNMAVRDPSYLFDTAEFKKTGAILWPDYGRLEPDRFAWDITGIPYRDEPEVESGQIVIDREKCWKPLNLAMWYNEHSDFFYRYLHGDKESFHLAFRRLGQGYSMPLTGIHPLQGTMCQHDFEGKRIFQHRNMEKWNLWGENARVGGFEFEAQCLRDIDELRTKWKGEIAFGYDGDGEPAKDQGGIAGSYTYERVGYDQRNLELREDGSVGRGAAQMESLWRLLHDRDGGRTLGIFGEEGFPTCYLKEKDRGRWEGNWVDHERMPIALRRLPENALRALPSLKGMAQSGS